jgi:ubiquinone/menaquinone biosynthesis C-methylase UbiE
MNFISRFFIKKVARQLRKPSGRMAKKVGRKMNESNGLLYDFTLDEMQLTEGDNILEIGFGNGKFFDKIFSRRNNLTISGLDYSAEMVNEARRHNKDAIDAGRLILRYGNSDKIPFPDNNFDKVFCINVIYFWDNPGQHLQEIYRVLKPGGKFYSVLRDKETMLQIPFTKFGFNMYEQSEWESVLKNNRFNIRGVKKISGQEFKLRDKKYQNLSWCFIGEKMS